MPSSDISPEGVGVGGENGGRSRNAAEVNLHIHQVTRSRLTGCTQAGRVRYQFHGEISGDLRIFPMDFDQSTLVVQATTHAPSPPTTP